MGLCRWDFSQNHCFLLCSEGVETLPKVSQVTIKPRNERIGLSTFICGAICHKRTRPGTLATTFTSTIFRKFPAFWIHLRREWWILVYEHTWAPEILCTVVFGAEVELGIFIEILGSYVLFWCAEIMNFPKKIFWENSWFRRIRKVHNYLGFQ